MNIYLISQDVNKNYDTYDSAVVVASSEEEARLMKPYSREHGDEWARPRDVKVIKIGVADESESRVVCASFNAG